MLLNTWINETVASTCVLSPSFFFFSFFCTDEDFKTVHLSNIWCWRCIPVLTTHVCNICQNHAYKRKQTLQKQFLSINCFPVPLIWPFVIRSYCACLLCLPRRLPPPINLFGDMRAQVLSRGNTLSEDYSRICDTYYGVYRQPHLSKEGRWCFWMVIELSIIIKLNCGQSCIQDGTADLPSLEKNHTHTQTHYSFEVWLKFEGDSKIWELCHTWMVRLMNWIALLGSLINCTDILTRLD